MKMNQKHKYKSFDLWSAVKYDQLIEENNENIINIYNNFIKKKIQKN